MRRLYPPTAIATATIALFIALSSSGFAGATKATRQLQVLGSTITVTKNLPLAKPSGFVRCPKGYQAIGGGYDSFRLPDYSIDYDGPGFWNEAASAPDGYRDTGEGVQRPADGWWVAAVRTPSLPEGPAAPLKVVVICAKLVRVPA